MPTGHHSVYQYRSSRFIGLIRIRTPEQETIDPTQIAGGRGLHQFFRLGSLLSVNRQRQENNEYHSNGKSSGFHLINYRQVTVLIPYN